MVSFHLLQQERIARTKVQTFLDPNDKHSGYVFFSFRVLNNRLPFIRTRYTTLGKHQSQKPTRRIEAVLTRIVILVLDDRCTTNSKDMTTLTAIPTSTFHTTVHMKVSNINERSVYARILHSDSPNQKLFVCSRGYVHLLPEEYNIMWSLS